MTPSQWLEENVREFRQLAQEERESMYTFATLWSLFEFRLLNRSANRNTLKQLVERWGQQGDLNIAVFESPLNYFRERYFVSENPTPHFKMLVMDNLLPDEVIEVLKGRNVKVGDQVYACLMVTFRFRNNLFHGNKWITGLRNERDNFHHGNQVLMAALDLG